MNWDISIAGYIQMGGWVMYPLIGLAAALAFLVVERFMFLGALQKNDVSPDEVIDVLQDQSRQAASGTGVNGELLNRLLRARVLYRRLDKSIVHEVTAAFTAELKTNLVLIASLTSAAPLLGLLGTVSGMVTTFNVMNIFGTGNVKAMSGGISEAMITTQFGLVVAIIGLYVGMILNRRARALETAVGDISVHIMRKFNL